jgi:hypothetical protein
VQSNPESILLKGSELLKPLFSQHSFVFAMLGSGSSSGGRFAFAEFRRGDRSFEFHFRSSLGMVTYHLGAESISHQEYMCSVLGKHGLSRYPGFSPDPLDAFRDLHADLQRHCDEFLEGTNEAFMRRVANARLQSANRPKLPE